MWTKERMLDLLDNSDLAVERAIVVLFKRQTHDEQRDNDTKHHNQRGFRSNHASTGSFYAKIILKGWKELNGRNRTHLNPHKMQKARRIVSQYTRQLIEEAEKTQQRKEEAMKKES